MSEPHGPSGLGQPEDPTRKEARERIAQLERSLDETVAILADAVPGMAGSPSDFAHVVVGHLDTLRERDKRSRELLALIMVTDPASDQTKVRAEIQEHLEAKP